MTKTGIIIFKILRRAYLHCFGDGLPDLNDIKISQIDEVSNLIYNLLVSDKPCMIARYGSTELSCILNYKGVAIDGPKHIDYIRGKSQQWWWNDNILSQMARWSGFFPATTDNATRFGALMLEDSKQLDILAIWDKSALHLKPYIGDIPLVGLLAVEPYWSNCPWTKALKGKKVLVVHPFADLISDQYHKKQRLLFKDPNILPDFNLLTIKAVQSLGGHSDNFDNWFEALEWTKREMDKMNYDIALIGCGAYGFPLAAHAKRTGHKAVHLAGALQLLFGIRGKRWDDPNYGSATLGKSGMYQTLFNEHWVYPSDTLKPATSNDVEGGCYW